jgi:hypothetical protein
MNQDVMFRQIQQPSRMGLCDSTDVCDLGVIVSGRHLKHRLYCSGFERGRRAKGAGAVNVVDYHHIIAALRAKPGALANLAYRDALWPRSAYRRAWDALTADGPVRDAARTMVGLLVLAHDRGVEADLAAAIDARLDPGELPDLATMLRRFTPKATAAPEVLIIRSSCLPWLPMTD